MARPKKEKHIEEVVVEVEEAPLPQVTPVSEEQLVELNKGLAPTEMEVVMVQDQPVKVVEKQDVVINGKPYVQVKSVEGVTYLL